MRILIKALLVETLPSSFCTLLEFGEADVTVNQFEFKPHDNYERIIAVPFLATSGKINVEGPETDSPRTFALSPGNYRLVAAQRVAGDDEEAIDLFFELLTKPLEGIKIIKMDDALNPPPLLVETAKVAGED